MRSRSTRPSAPRPHWMFQVMSFMMCTIDTRLARRIDPPAFSRPPAGGCRMDVQQTFLKLAIALALGLLVGLQRERVDSRIAGVRTFPLITLLGAVTALAAPSLGPWLVAAGMLALAAMLVIANIAKLRVETDPGLTTEIAALLMYGVGAYLVVGHGAAAVAVGGAVVLLLHLKQPLHRFVAAMGERDVSAIMQFALITLVILPVLPNRNVGPYDALNP